MPNDATELADELRLKAAAHIFRRSTQHRAQLTLNSPLLSDSADPNVRRHIDCYLAPDQAGLVYRYFEKQSTWIADGSSEGIEFRGCPYYETEKLLISGRMYFQTDVLQGATIIAKSANFLKWADRVFRIAKKRLRYSKRCDVYLGEGAENFVANGGKVAWFLKADGTPSFCEAF